MINLILCVYHHGSRCFQMRMPVCYLFVNFYASKIFNHGNDLSGRVCSLSFKGSVWVNVFKDMGFFSIKFNNIRRSFRQQA